jgi:hypothetical protein
MLFSQKFHIHPPDHRSHFIFDVLCFCVFWTRDVFATHRHSHMIDSVSCYPRAASRWLVWYNFAVDPGADVASSFPPNSGTAIIPSPQEQRQQTSVPLLIPTPSAAATGKHRHRNVPTRTAKLRVCGEPHLLHLPLSEVGKGTEKSNVVSEPWGSVKDREFLGYLSDCWLVRKGFLLLELSCDLTCDCFWRW